VFAQLIIKAGIRLYCEESIQGLMQEFDQLEDLGVSLSKLSKRTN